jgi:ribosomal protein L7Ae-like RNA K-turn-binding protein
VKKGGFARALKRPVTWSAEDVCQMMAGDFEARAMSLVLAAARRKELAVGIDAVREALTQGRVAVLLVAADAEGGREELETTLARLGRRCVLLGTKESLGRLFGREQVAVLGVLEMSIGNEIARCTEHRAELAEAK